MSQRHHLLWTSIAAGWLLIAFSFTLNYFIFAHHYVEIFSPPPTFGQMLVWEIPYWLLWGAIAPAVFAVTRRFPLEFQNWRANALIHLGAACLFSIAHRIIYLPLCWLLYVDAYRNKPTLLDLYRSDLFFNLQTGLMCYGTILLVSNVIDYYERYQAGELRTLQLHAQLAQAQLQALRMQLQPHFLFNTLNSISALQLTDIEAANQMTARLGDFLRMTLDNVGTQVVTLREELDFLKSYLEIERIRFQDRLQVTMEIAAEALDLKVPNLILQPIIENAIKFAVVNNSEIGIIHLRAQRLNGSLQIEVEDNGIGLQLPMNSTRATRGGVGLANTEARLKQLYGNEYRFELMNAKAGGVLVTINIPAEL